MERCPRIVELLLAGGFCLGVAMPAQAHPLFAKSLTQELDLKRTSCHACHLTQNAPYTRNRFGERFDAELPEGLVARYQLAGETDDARAKLLGEFRQAVPRVMAQELGSYTLGELAQAGKLKGIKPKRS